MDTTTINGLHSCKPDNEPIIGQVKLFVIEQRKGKSGKPYIRIRNANEENGGTPHRILNAEPSMTKEGTQYTDQHGNISFNLEVEEATSAPSQVQQLRKIVKGEPEQGEYFHEPDSDWPEAQQGKVLPYAEALDKPISEPKPPPAHPNSELDMVRRRLMQAVNLEVLCIRAVDKGIAPHCPEIAQTADFFQSQVASLFIWATRQGLENKMPETPIQ